MAVAHIVLIKFKPSVSEEHIQEVLRSVADLKTQLSGVIESVHLGVSFSTRSKGYTHGFTMMFKNKEDLEFFDKSPEHIRLLNDLVHLYVHDYLIVDYETVDYSSPRL